MKRKGIIDALELACLLGLAAISYACLFYRPLLLAMALGNLGFLLACVIAWVLRREPRQPARLRQRFDGARRIGYGLPGKERHGNPEIQKRPTLEGIHR